MGSHTIGLIKPVKKSGDTHVLRSKIVGAADDYMLGHELPDFAKENGGLDKLRDELFELLTAYNYPNG